MSKQHKPTTQKEGKTFKRKEVTCDESQ